MNNIKTVGLMAFLGAIFVLVGQALGGSNGAVIALIFVGGLNFAMYFFSDRLALASARARPVEEHELPQVYSIVRSLTEREGMPMPKIYLIDAPQPNAFATGRSPRHAAVAVTTGILQLMDHDELEGVLAHEISHVRNRDVLIGTIAATVAAALSFLARMAMFRSMFGGNNNRDNNPLAGLVALISIIVAPIAAMLIRFAISRSREYEADRSGAEISGNPLALARALQKLEAGTSRIPMDVNPSTAQLFIADPLKAFGNRGRGGQRQSGMTKLFSTHPPIADRVERLMQMGQGWR